MAGSGVGGALFLTGPLCSQLNPILADIEYLQDQHLLLTVKSMDGYESYGEGRGGLRGTESRAGP